MMQEHIEGVPVPGETILGKFEVIRVLGMGGMGVVLAARHVQLGHQVAIKFLLPQAAQHGEAVARFLREAQATVRLQGEHAVRVTDVGTLDTGSPYMVMEYLTGEDLGQVVRACGPLPIEESVDYVLQACEAIAEAHALGIVHRDLKPANLFRSTRPDGSALIKVLDFGISKSTHGAHAMNLTATTAVMGSPVYMSPEQVRSTKNVDARTDIWALGIILQELLTGSPPFDADTMPALCAMIIADPPTPLRIKRPDAPPELEAVLQKCLEKDVTRRFANVAELSHALLPFGPRSARLHVERIMKLGGSSLSLSMPESARAPAAVAQTETVHGTTAGAWGKTGSSTPQRKTAVYAIGAVAALAAVAAGVGFVTFGGGDRDAQIAEPPQTVITALTEAPPEEPMKPVLIPALAAQPEETEDDSKSKGTEDAGAAKAQAPAKTAVQPVVKRMTTKPAPSVQGTKTQAPTQTTTPPPPPASTTKGTPIDILRDRR